jgi:hypothetical protein
MKTEADQMKQEMRRKLFARGKLPNASEYFLKCPTCDGTGRHCKDYITEAGSRAADLIVCPQCSGVGFIENNA